MSEDRPGETAPAEELVRTAYARECEDAGILYEGMSLADIAHLVSLIDSGIVPSKPGGELLSVLLQMHPKPPLDFAVDPARGDLYTNREAYIALGSPHVGWLATGRARREATTIAYRIATGSRLLSLSQALEDWVEASLSRAEEHRSTLFPDYTYLQPAQPTTFGHYLLTFVYPALRDLDRLRSAFERTNLSPAGSGSVNGSRLPLDRDSLAELLGFDGVIAHTRDAMWQADGPIEIASAIASILVNLDRLAEDLQIFTTAELGLVELDSAYTRASVIMPQKKNPYALAYLRGLAGETIGLVAAMAAVGKTPSGQIDNRMFAYGDIPRGVDRARDAVRLATGVVRSLIVHAAAAARRSRQHFTGATDLADVLTMEKGLDYKSAHLLVGRAVRRAEQSGSSTLRIEDLEAAAVEILGEELDLPPQKLTEALDPSRIVATRTGRGGASEASIHEMLAECRTRVREHARFRQGAQAKRAEARARLLQRAAELRRPPSEGSAGERQRELKSWEEEFEGLPRPPRKRRFKFGFE